MKTTVSMLLLFLIFSYSLHADRWRSGNQADVIHYSFTISLNDTSDVVNITSVIRFRFTAEEDTAILGLRNQGSDGRGMLVSQLSFDTSGYRWSHQNDKLYIISDNPVPAGTHVTITVSYSGIPADGLIISRNKFGKRTFFADHWPDRAINYLPVVAHPSDKATVDYTIIAPDHYKVVASGLPAGEAISGKGYTITAWKETIPLPVKVMAFGAADFSVKNEAVIDDIPVSSWVFTENRDQGFSDYAVAVKPMRFYSDYVGPYPFKKLANVQSRTIFGGLENAGNIFYSENSVTGNGRAESLIAHEIAHQWFGNSVTERDWNHIWLSEGFATYLTSLYLENTYGAERLKESMRSARERVLRSSEKNARPVIDTTVNSLMSLLNANSYQKGSWVLHMLRNEVGDEAFREGLRAYYHTFRDSTALTDDFRRIMEKSSGKSLETFFNQWLLIPGEPLLKIYPVKNNAGSIDIVVEQMQEHIFVFPIDIKISDGKSTKRVTFPVNERITRYPVIAGENIKLEADPDVKLLFREAHGQIVN